MSKSLFLKFFIEKMYQKGIGISLLCYKYCESVNVMKFKTL